MTEPRTPLDAQAVQDLNKAAENLDDAVRGSDETALTSRGVTAEQGTEALNEALRNLA